jgi:hypothetical protein
MLRSTENITRIITISLFLFTFTSQAYAAEASKENTKQSKYQNFNWSSPNNWQGAVFDVPTWFAKDMLYDGREVIRFHDGFYDKTSTGFWTYAFALLITQTEVPTTEMLIEETKRYFVGLARDLGDYNQSDYAVNNISVIPKSKWQASKDGSHRTKIFKLQIFDSFTTGKKIQLNLKITSWLCSDTRRAIHYAISPHPLSDSIWTELNNEITALKCW